MTPNWAAQLPFPLFRVQSTFQGTSAIRNMCDRFAEENINSEDLNPFKILTAMIEKRFGRTFNTACQICSDTAF